MESEDASADSPRHLVRRHDENSLALTGEASQSTAISVSNSPSTTGLSLIGDQADSIISQTLSTIDDNLIDPTVLSDEDNEEWTQIPGPSDGDMSDSDDSTSGTTVQYQIPRAIRIAEQSSMHRPSSLHTTQQIHRRYVGFALLLCKETATGYTHQHLLEGLPIAIDTAMSIRLDDTTANDDELDVYAFALVIHIWQIVCLRMQHGELPSANMDEILCLEWTAYFLSAHSLVKKDCGVSSDALTFAVQYWEDRLKLTGRGNRWMEDSWTQKVPQLNQDDMIHRNDPADRYLEALEKCGKEGVTIRVIEEEKKGEKTQLRTMIEETVDGMKTARRQIASMLYSMDTSLLKAMIQGQLPRLAEIKSGPVYQALKDLNEQGFIQPGTYMNCICDYAGMSPTPEQWRRVCEQMLKYVHYSDKHNDLAEQIDQQIHPKTEWPKELAHKGLRRYTEWRSFTERGTYSPDSGHRGWVRYFVDQLEKRMQGQPVHAPLNVPVVEIGFSNDPRKRLRQHRHHESSNYLMNLAEAVFSLEYPGSFRLQQKIVFACYRSIQTWLSEIVVTQLAQGYVEGGAGFSHEPAGRSNTSSNKRVPTKIWTLFEAQIYANDRMEKEVMANSQQLLDRLQAKRQARNQEEEQREREAEATRRVQLARVAHLRNMIALEEARNDLHDALRRLEF